MKRYKVITQSDNGEVVIIVNATSVDNAKNIVMDIEKMPPSAIKKIEVVRAPQRELQENKFKKFKEKVNSMTVDDFTEFESVMYRTFNFIWSLEELDIEEVNHLQDTPKTQFISMTSKELMSFFYKELDMDIE